VLLKIKQNIETVSGEKFNSVLANLYRDGSDSMGWHSDDESSIKQDTSIASVSFGEQRPIFFKHKTDDISFSIDQSHGSLIIMNGETQKFWKHSIKKSKKLMKPRINLTFRTIITS
jgi:alkylated DNA repair dioxygenase AlkB